MQEEIKFTFEAAFDIQKSQLQIWANKLNKECYLALEHWVKTENKKGYSNPYLVLRGIDLNNFVANYKPSIATKYDGI